MGEGRNTYSYLSFQCRILIDKYWNDKYWGVNKFVKWSMTFPYGAEGLRRRLVIVGKRGGGGGGGGACAWEKVKEWWCVYCRMKVMQWLLYCVK